MLLSLTTTNVVDSVIERERQGKYLGKTVQVVPHIVDAIQEWIENVAKQPVRDGATGSLSVPDVCVIELGGTVGDIESAAFVEALRQMAFRVGRDDFVSMHVSLVPIAADNEQKTKPTQTTVAQLRALGETIVFIYLFIYSNKLLFFVNLSFGACLLRDVCLASKASRPTLSCVARRRRSRRRQFRNCQCFVK